VAQGARDIATEMTSRSLNIYPYQSRCMILSYTVEAAEEHDVGLSDRHDASSILATANPSLCLYERLHTVAPGYIAATIYSHC
jgi:hypothetical protein